MLYEDNTAKLLGLEEVIVKKCGMRGKKNTSRSSCRGGIMSAPAVERRQLGYTTTACRRSGISLHSERTYICIFASAVTPLVC